MSIIIYNLSSKKEITPKIFLSQPLCILPFINKKHYKNTDKIKNIKNKLI